MGGYCSAMSDDRKPSEPDLSFEFGHDRAAARLAREAIAPPEALLSLLRGEKVATVTC
jgi:hypothetical protein